MSETRSLVLYPRHVFEAIRNKGRGDCGPAALWQLIYGGWPSTRDLKSMRNMAVDEVYSHSSRYIDFFDGETETARRQSLYKWTTEMRQSGIWADQLFVNAIARAHMVNIRILVPEEGNTLRDEQGNYAGQGPARKTFFMLHSGGAISEALKVLGEVKPIERCVTTQEASEEMATEEEE